MKKSEAKMIKVDLNKEKFEILPLREDLIRDYIGGEGIGSRLLWEMLKPRTEPYAPENVILFVTAPKYRGKMAFRTKICRV
jgi:aldehyde:ferredoxin oxidoreductase